MSMIKTEDQIDCMRVACKETCAVLKRLIQMTRIGMTGYDIDILARKLFEDVGVEPAFYGLYGFPAILCISVNEQLIHGLPNMKPFQNGDVIRYDIGARYKGFCSDTARTFVLGTAKDPRHLDVIDAAQRALDAGISVIKDGATLKEVGAAIEAVALEGGYGNVTRFHGHGIGENVHEDPAVQNCEVLAKPLILRAGMTLALEPMLTLGSGVMVVDPDNKWNIHAEDNSIGAHVEDTVLVTKTGFEILTR